MARRKMQDFPPAIIKYTMYSILPGMGSQRGFYAKLGGSEYDLKHFGRVITYAEMTATPMKEKEAKDFIAAHGLTQKISNSDTTLYIQPGEWFRDYCRSHLIAVPDNLGATTIFDTEYRFRRDK